MEADMLHPTLKGKVIVITGASSGFGKGVARKFSSEGACVVLAARRGPLLDALTREIEEAGGDALPVLSDVSRRSDVERLAEQAISRFGRIDVWFNNAGVGALGRFEDVPLSDHVQVIETDLLGTMYGSYVAMQRFRRQGHGTLINMASVLGKVPAPYYASYTAAKYGIVGLSAALRLELRQNRVPDIHVCTVMPTTFDTPFFDHIANYTGHEVKLIPPVYKPERVIDTVVRLAVHPEDEVMIGTAAKVSGIAHQIAPDTTEKLWAAQVHRTQIEQAGPADFSKGAVHEPVSAGTEVSGGRLQAHGDGHRAQAHH
jgi:NAD(P)-dependent dehydrogenase (short-subunit alcohol dehydrogenase family)